MTRPTVTARVMDAVIDAMIGLGAFIVVMLIPDIIAWVFERVVS